MTLKKSHRYYHLGFPRNFSSTHALYRGLKLATIKKQFMTLRRGRQDWFDSLSSTQMKIIWVVEALGGFGLMLPQILNIAVWLTLLAALGAVCTMIGTIVLHIRRKDDAEAIATNLFIIALAVFVAYNMSELIV